MIRSFRNNKTEAIYRGQRVKGHSTALQNAARRKLRMVHAAASINDLRVPPANRLEKLQHDRKGQHSVRINDQWRICFVWRNGHAHNVEITDYHRG